MDTKTKQELVREQTHIACRFMTKTPTPDEIRQMMDSSITSGVDVEYIVNEITNQK